MRKSIVALARLFAAIFWLTLGLCVIGLFVDHTWEPVVPVCARIAGATWVLGFIAKLVAKAIWGRNALTAPIPVVFTKE